MRQKAIACLVSGTLSHAPRPAVICDAIQNAIAGNEQRSLACSSHISASFRYRAVIFQDPKAEIASMVWRYMHAKTIASSSCVSIQHSFDKFGHPGPREIAGTVNPVKMLTRSRPSQYGQTSSPHCAGKFGAQNKSPLHNQHVSLCCKTQTWVRRSVMLATLGGIVSIGGVNGTRPSHEMLPSEIDSHTSCDSTMNKSIRSPHNRPSG